ncbi:MAG: bifunctional demethylmenaquinone methyltransferase/2-methoxy-6-polyprenyl-1,4-benzoquinol methylase UbiE [Planctomycetes bacterium]|nr:bifunctional demethylmenaquinone methyltransferase/2-methoxy-6-polyprenyl-1,4-benzoquinol methylase UbiE [Planctomycetota bacterium]
MPVDKSPARIRRMFGQIAPRYDLLNHLLSLNVDRLWRRRTVRRVRPEGDGPILDVCSGTGDLALAYHRRSGSAVKVVGTDFCHEMLDLGRGKARRADAGDRVVFVEADAQRLPFSDDTFQIVCVAFGLRNLSDTDRGLSEMARVCRPGGRVAVLEFTMPTSWPLRTLYGWYFRRILPRLGQAITRSQDSAYEYLPSSVGEFPQGEALAQRMRGAGMSRVEFHRLTFGVATLYVGVK